MAERFDIDVGYRDPGFRDEVMLIVEQFGDRTYEEAYLQALWDADVLGEDELIPEKWERLLARRLLERRGPMAGEA